VLAPRASLLRHQAVSRRHTWGTLSVSEQSLTLSVSEQSSRTTPRASSAPRHRHGPQSTAARPSWTLAHVDHRLIPPNYHVPNLSRHKRDRSDPKRGEDDLIQIIRILTVPLKLGTEKQLIEGHRELLF
jgi:hypothetical protein